ncbi:ABC transporter permease [Helicobacter winghamensis]|uniref:Methionine ABC transporter permease n=1 Tax=Helicobacter winghamensis TaxID=157268 RepID=A0A2N3PIC2_9HELI|nr:ABC transporter permease subunit [Helicobacter winghamensis]EEO25732.1 D-methionine transport system permease protein MetI [Helicobacter winghamensis ATCC BAA-430]PKT76024.1 methionine ABC transporter permease [Helicobacter winghamensis]PKT76654.1 methionine ABC transporter permease [Helicobacter winghamensis]PKT76773.1 methionine ABC transporter permease [Helicobacter winghamensis]PKT80534.1 methionine ABC transporter permease [Helicobacter winghamensis]
MDSKMFYLLLEATFDTLYMSVVATLIATALAILPSILLVLCAPNGLSPNALVFRVLDSITNTLRSFPFLILMVVLFPLTQILVGKSIGATAAIVPLSIGAAPFIVRIIENALKEVDKGVIEAALSFGATNLQIIFRIMLIEALPSIISGITLALILVVGFSAMAGAVGGGGLGDIAIKYGYYRFQSDIMLYTVLVLIFLVQIIQSLGDFLYRKLKH